MKKHLNHIAQQLSAHFNQAIQIKSQQQVFGGDINQTYHLQTNIGSFFLKLNGGSLKDMFQKEFESLRLLLQTKTIKIPEPVLYGEFFEVVIPTNLKPLIPSNIESIIPADLKPVIPAKAGISSNQNKIFLVTEFIQKGNSSNNFWQTFAQQLAALHKYSHAKFGLSNNNYIGSLQQQNNYCNTWSEFYTTQRIMPLMQLTFKQNKCNKQDVIIAEKLCSRFDNLLPEEKPALIHGDLWSGNFMGDKNGEPVIYDPAVYYGNREMDIAMSLLFSGFDKSFYEYYNETFPLQQNWKERVQLCQLYPLIMHLILFGGHYYNNVINILKAYQ